MYLRINQLWSKKNVILCIHKILYFSLLMLPFCPIFIKIRILACFLLLLSFLLLMFTQAIVAYAITYYTVAYYTVAYYTVHRCLFATSGAFVFWKNKNQNLKLKSKGGKNVVWRLMLILVNLIYKIKLKMKQQKWIKKVDDKPIQINYQSSYILGWIFN